MRIRIQGWDDLRRPCPSVVPLPDSLHATGTAPSWVLEIVPKDMRTGGTPGGATSGQLGQRQDLFQLDPPFSDNRLTVASLDFSEDLSAVSNA